MIPTDEQIRDTKRDLIALAIACFNGLEPREIAEKAMKFLEEYDQKLKNQRNEYEPNDVMV